MSARADRAEELFLEGFACSQAVFSVLAPELGLEAGIAARIAGPFGGGLGRRGEVCGAVSGALMAVGLAAGSAAPEDEAAKERAHALAREVCARFQERHGALRCSDLLGCEILSASGRAEAQRRGLFRDVCPRLVRDAVEIAGEVLGRGSAGGA